MEQNFHQRLSLLKLYYAHLINLLDVFCSGYIAHANEKINRVYLVLINKIESILQNEEFSELSKDYERPFSNLLGKEAKEADIYWKDGSLGEKMRDFYSKIEEIFIKNNEKPLPIEKLPNKKELEENVKMVEATIELLKQLTEEDKIRLEKTVIELKDKIPFLGTEEKISMGTSIQADNNAIVEGGKPYTEIENGKGYFKFYRQGKRIIIGSKSTRQFRLLQCLCEPHFGIQKEVEAVFEAIRKPKDNNDSRLSDYGPQKKTRILELIEWSKKELQKIPELKGKIKYKMDDRRRRMWLELEG